MRNVHWPFAAFGFWSCLSAGVLLPGCAVVGKAGTTSTTTTDIQIAIDLPRQTRLHAGCLPTDQGEAALHDGISPDFVANASSRIEIFGTHTIIPPDYKQPISLPQFQQYKAWNLTSSDCRGNAHLSLCWVKNLRMAHLALEASKGILYSLHDQTATGSRTYCTVLVNVSIPTAAYNAILVADAPNPAPNCSMGGPVQPGGTAAQICFPEVKTPIPDWSNLMKDRAKLYAEADDVLAKAEQDFTAVAPGQ